MSPPSRRGRRAALRSAATSAVLLAALAVAACDRDTTIDPIRVVPGDRGPLATSVGRNVQVGDRVEINGDSAVCRTTDLRIGTRPGRVVAVSNRAVIVADSTNPAGGFTAADYQSFAAQFDTLVYPVDVRHFGAPSDIDDNGRVVIFFTSAVNALTPSGAGFVIGGFFFNRDLFPVVETSGRRACAGSNDGELFYMLVPDPLGTVNGNRRTVESVRLSTVGVLAHEFQHLINAGRRLFVLNTPNYDEEIWLNEGLSHVAEELNFYQAAGLSAAGQAGQSPRAGITAAALRQENRRIDALNGFGIQNLQRVSRYLRATDANSPYANNDSLPTRGATWGFLRYTADRSERDSLFLYSLVNSTKLGVANVRDAITAAGLAQPLEALLRDWAVANYADGIPGTTTPATYQNRSWRFRDVLTQLRVGGGGLFNDGVYPLSARTLAAGQTQPAVLVPGGAAYFTFSVAAGGTATARVTVAGAAPPATTRAALVALLPGGTQVTPFDGTAVGTIPVTNSTSTGVTYVLVLVNVEPTITSTPASLARNYQVSLAGGAVASVLASRAAGGAEGAQPPAGPLAVRLAGDDAPLITDAPIMSRLREASARELGPLVGEARAQFGARGRRMMPPAGRF